jgi:hypothetical protein
VPSISINPWRGLLCCALAWSLPSNASVIVQLKVLEGEGALYHTGSRATRGLTVLVTDETGQPIPNAAVSFRLPDEGASGVFSSGLRTEVVTTGPDGRASVWGMQWNKTAGPVEIRITAIKDQARAGIMSTVYLSAETAATPRIGGEGQFTAPRKGHGKLILIGLIAGGAAAGLAFGRSQGVKNASATSASSGISIGGPSIIVGRP